MSLILEALRKSEAERRRGQTPDLLSDATIVAPTARTATRNTGAMIAVVVAALLTLLLVAWWLKPAVVEPRDEGTPADSSPVALSSAPPSSSRPQTPLRAPASKPSTAAGTPAPLTPPRTAAQPVPANADAETTRDNSERTAAAVEPEPAPLPQPIVLPEPRQLEPLATQPAFTSQDMPLKLSDLSSDERQQLPTLKVSMHMWASETTNRFAIIDGARVNEGDRVGEATVDAIQPDGVLLSWRGRRIRLPIR